MILNEQLAITLVSRFLNHLEILDTINADGNENIVDKQMESEHADAVLKNLLAVGKFLGEHSEIKWIGAAKRKELQSKEDSESVESSDSEEIEQDEADLSENITKFASTDLSSSPFAFVVLMDKICKIGRKARRALLISSCLKFYAAILISSCTEFVEIPEYEPVFLSMLKFIDHVQTFTISRDQSRSQEWRSALELSSALLDRLKNLLGEDRHSALNLKLVKSMSAARLARREEKRQMVLMEPEKAAKLKSKENQKKYRARKKKSSNSVTKKRK